MKMPIQFSKTSSKNVQKLGQSSWDDITLQELSCKISGKFGALKENRLKTHLEKTFWTPLETILVSFWSPTAIRKKWGKNAFLFGKIARLSNSNRVAKKPLFGATCKDSREREGLKIRICSHKGTPPLQATHYISSLLRSCSRKYLLYLPSLVALRKWHLL